MKVNSIYTSRIIKRGLEFAADNGALFAAGTTLALSLGVRPLSILSAPKTDKENKKVACAKSITSSLIGYAIMLLASKPLSHAIKKIDAEPVKYLKQETVQALKNGAEELTKSKAYILATQLFKLGLGAVIAAPKAILTAIGVPVILKAIQKPEEQSHKDVSFTGNPNNLTKNIAKIIDKKWFQDFSLKYKDSNFPMHIMALTDALTTATFVSRVKASKQIKEERKNPLIYNSVISTGLSISAGYTLDKLLDKPADKFIEKFKEINKDSPKLDKYIEGIKIAKPILILGAVYYTLIPIVSTFLADRIKDNKKEAL